MIFIQNINTFSCLITQKPKGTCEFHCYCKKIFYSKVYKIYFEKFIVAHSKIATVKKSINVLQRIMGYCKNKATKDEKEELKNIIQNYHNEFVPLVVQATLLNHYIREFKWNL